MRNLRFAIVLVGLLTTLCGCGGSESEGDGEKSLSPEQAAENARLKKNLTAIGLAMYNYHKVHSRFPSNDSNGYSPYFKERKTGLSWRVYLLPYLGQKELYDQFKHDEPWDGPHNKTLIAKMPDVFKTPGGEGGKTSIHVFVSNDGDKVERWHQPPFGRKYGKASIGPKFRDIRDGTRNTIMAAVAGPDKADVWTKPGGLPFHPDKNALEAMGEIPQDGFFVLFFDGFVGKIESRITPEQMKLLIQHADAKPVGDIPGIKR